MVLVHLTAGLETFKIMEPNIQATHTQSFLSSSKEKKNFQWPSNFKFYLMSQIFILGLLSQTVERKNTNIFLQMVTHLAMSSYVL